MQGAAAARSVPRWGCDRPHTGSPRALLSPKPHPGLETGQEEEGGWPCSCPDHPCAYLLGLGGSWGPRGTNGDLRGQTGTSGDKQGARRGSQSAHRDLLAIRRGVWGFGGASRGTGKGPGSVGVQGGDPGVPWGELGVAARGFGGAAGAVWGARGGSGRAPMSPHSPARPADVAFKVARSGGTRPRPGLRLGGAVTVRGRQRGEIGRAHV